SAIAEFRVSLGNSFVVTNLNDGGPGSLRQALRDANGAPNGTNTDKITFQTGLTGTITLTSGQLYATDAVNIVGPGAATISVDGGNSYRLLYLPDVGMAGPAP